MYGVSRAKTAIVSRLGDIIELKKNIDRLPWQSSKSRQWTVGISDCQPDGHGASVFRDPGREE